MSDPKQINVVISGKVQGVFFRDFVKEKADELSIVGYAENTQNDCVYVVAQGKEGDLNKFIERLHQGSQHSNVLRVGVEWVEKKGIYSDFKSVYK